MDPQFKVPPAVVTVIGLGAAIIGGLMAYRTTEEGVELLEDTVNNTVEKVKNRKNKKTPPPPAE